VTDAPRVTLLIPAYASAGSLERTVEEAHRFLQSRHGDAFEIIMVPDESSGDGTVEIAQLLAARLPHARIAPHSGVAGKGAALRTGFEKARGEWIFFTDADLPYDLAFFDHAEAALRTGADLVTGNRRLLVSEFDVPVRLLRLAYRRHRLGLLFNRFARWLLPIETTDTQAGIKAMSRRMAERGFALQTCPGFFFDLELFLTAHRSGYHHRELPVILYLNSEKSTVRVLRESFFAGYWLLRITWQDRRGRYGRAA
jgi:dolichyl-phosphate beta-glucosyltransferase